MSNIKNPPAFPHSRLGSDSDGMTLRDHFAGLAMQGFAADPNTCAKADDIATCAYRWADAMLKAREKQ